MGSCGAEAFAEATTFCSKLRDAARTYHDGLQASTKVLDFGMGWGRLYRVMLNHVSPTCLIGADIDPMCVQLCTEAMPYGTFVQNAISAPLQFPDGALDIVYAYSVFSHLAPEVAHGWLVDFRRVLRSGGLVVFTTLKPAHLGVWRHQLSSGVPDFSTCLERVGFDHDAWSERAQRGEALYLPIGGGDLRDSTFYGETVIAEPGAAKLAAESGLEMRVFEEGPDLPQSFVVFQRPEASSPGGA